jgi:actin-related protein
MGEEQAIVLDNGSGFIKAGFAGENSPSIIIPTNIESSFKNPISHGIITDWNMMVKY